MGERDRMLVAESYFSELKLENDSAAAFRYLNTHVFGHYYMKFLCKEILFFFGHCHVTFPYMEPLSFFGRFLEKVTLFCFSDSFVQKITQQKGASADDKIAAVMLQVIPCFYTNYSKNSLFISANTYE